MSDYRPTGPYIKFKGKERQLYRNEAGVKIDEVVEKIAFFEPRGCHLNQESIDMVRGKGNRQMLEYGNFPNTPAWNAFAAMLDRCYGREMEFSKREREGEESIPRKRNTSARVVSARAKEGEHPSDV